MHWCTFLFAPLTRTVGALTHFFTISPKNGAGLKKLLVAAIAISNAAQIVLSPQPILGRPCINVVLIKRGFFMIIIRDILSLAILLIVCLLASPALSATYYISPTGSDANPGTLAKPWLTFSYAIDPARATCGDTLLLTNGTYGDGTSTGKISISKLICAAGNELTIRALNQRQAKIYDDGTGYTVRVQNSSHIIIDGLYARSNDNASGTYGKPIYVNDSHHITIRNNVVRNPNRYVNAHTYTAFRSQDILFEDNEAYVFHRHCVSAGQSERVVVRRQYCNPRGGRIPGGIAGIVGDADAVFSMYPCKDCILENSIADGTTHGIYLNEMNATYDNNVLTSGNKILGSICYKCSAGNGIYPNGRKVADLNHSPHNFIIRDVALIDFNSTGAAIKCQDCVNAVIDHVTVLGGGSGVTGILAIDSSFGATPAQNSITLTNILVAGLTGNGFNVSGYDTWSGDRLSSTGNRTAFRSSHPPTWLNTFTKAHGMGTCKVWVPDGAAVKGAGTGGSDIGANILYRYVNGVLTATPLWDPKTGEFPHGAADLDGTNRVEGQSLFDIHRRLNVNTGGCSFPRNYGNGYSDTILPVAPVGLRAS